MTFLWRWPVGPSNEINAALTRCMYKKGVSLRMDLFFISLGAILVGVGTLYAMYL